MGIVKEFKEFATKGNMLDLAIGVVIGGAFQSIINSLVSDVIMPLISIITGNVDFSDLVLEIGQASIKYGNFITALVNFLIIALSVFLALKAINSFNRKMEAISLGQLDKLSKKLGKGQKEEPEVEPLTKICPFCLSEIKYKATKCPHCTSDLTKVEEAK